MTGRRPWSAEDENHLRLMWGGGMSIKRMALALQRSENGIDHRARILNLPRRATRKDARLPSGPASGLPDTLFYEDDPRAILDHSPHPSAPPRDVTAAFTGDPAQAFVATRAAAGEPGRFFLP